jgi:transposase-like protein
MNALSAPHLHNEAAARAKLESIVWPNGPVCPRCGGQERITPVRGKTARPGLYRCGPCKRQFTVTVGTVFESSHVPLHVWFQAAVLMAASKKGVSAHQLHRSLGVAYKTAWFMAHRIREAMRTGDLAPMGIDGGIVEVDETFLGSERPKAKLARSYQHKMKILSLVDRNSGQAKSIVVDDLKVTTLFPILRENVAREAWIMTDEAGQYVTLGREFAVHLAVRHKLREWGRGEAHTNTIEGFCSIFKRGMKGVYQRCARHNLHRYLAEFDFRYCNRAALGVNDEDRATAILCGIVGKRLMFRDSSVV